MSDETRQAAEEDERRARIARGVRAVREGHGANCSSIGSVIDTLFATAVVGGAVFTAVAAALAREKVVIVGGGARDPAAGEPSSDAGERAAPGEERA